MIYLEFFVEEPSAETALRNLVPVILTGKLFEFDIYTFQGKTDLLKKLPRRLRAYQSWITDEHHLIVLVDRDNQDCHILKRRLETIAFEAGLNTRTVSPGNFHVINRIAIEELEAWFFGDIDALRTAYPHIPETLAKKATYRDPDAIRNTWEHLEDVLKDYHPGGLEKIRAADDISRYMNPDVNRSKSFQMFRDALCDLF